MDTKVFKQAIATGWRPVMVDGKQEYRIKSPKVTWIPHLERCIVQTDRGKLLLDKDDLEFAREYNLRRQLYAKENESHDRSGKYDNQPTYYRTIQRTGESQIS